MHYRQGAFVFAKIIPFSTSNNLLSYDIREKILNTVVRDNNTRVSVKKKRIQKILFVDELLLGLEKSICSQQTAASTFVYTWKEYFK